MTNKLPTHLPVAIRLFLVPLADKTALQKALEAELQELAVTFDQARTILARETFTSQKPSTLWRRSAATARSVTTTRHGI